MIYGARTSLFVAFSAVLLGTTLGSLWGVACGYIGGRFDLVSQRIMEIFQSFPDLILALAISMAIGTGLPAVIVAIAITRVPFGGRVIRSVALSVSAMPFVEAGRAAGASTLRVMARHVLPQCVAPYLVLATTHLGVAIVIEAALGFLGVGVPPPTPTWGNMLADAITGLVPQWWLVLFPGLAITVTVLAFNLLGDGIRDSLDPRLAPTVMRLVTGALWESGGYIHSRFSGRTDCADEVIETMQTQKPQVILPCYGDRIFGQTQDHEMAFALPWAMRDSLVNGLEGTHKGGVRYPIPSFMRYTGKFPPAYEELGKYWPA